jgi:BTB/POZ domain-containing protein 3/6
VYVVDNQDGSSDDIIQITQPSSAPTSPLSPLSPISSVAQQQPTPVQQVQQQPQRPISFNNAKASTLDPNWQATKISIRERNAAMFNNELMADIYFLVGPPGIAVNIFF